MIKNSMFLSFFIVFFCIAGLSAKTLSADSQEKTVAQLIDRLFPGKSSAFELYILKKTSAIDSFHVESLEDKIVIKGTNALALSKGLNEYLQKYCHISVSWYLADKIVLPELLPVVQTPFGQSCRFENRFFLNYCTFGYTMLWWNWQDWERLIDWMALNGINMPLAITGQEYIWQKVYQKFGMAPEESRKFFTGPGHLPWQRMGNLDRWLGPLPQSFIDGQFALQKQILARERSLGMKPVLPAFAGHVPYDLKKNYPNIKITNLGSYETGKENDAYFLDPTDPLFAKLQEAYLTEQQKLLGTDHYYGADPFNEMDPPSWEPAYLAATSRSIYSAMKKVDREAIWVQMGWTFYYDRKHWTNPRLEAMIKAVPEGKMILLDYFCEEVEIWRKTGGFFNAPYIWCYLGNFGGNTQLVAPLVKMAKILPAAEKDPNRRQMKGIGSTLEGFGVNNFIFEWLFDYAWDSTAVDTKKWINNYALRRTGAEDPVVQAAWQKVIPLVYNDQVSGVGVGNIIQAKPSLKGNPGYSRPSKYDYEALNRIFPMFLMASDKSRSNPAFLRDLTLLEKQIMVNLALNFRDSIALAYTAKNRKAFEKYTTLFLDLTDDEDKLTGTQHELLLGDWIAKARSFGKTAAEKNYYEKNARVLITTWGGEGSGLTNYAAKDWSGLISGLYKSRWVLFFNELRNTISTGAEPDMKAFDLKRAKLDWDWTSKNAETEQFQSNVHGNTFEVCKALYYKWVPFL